MTTIPVTKKLIYIVNVSLQAFLLDNTFDCLCIACIASKQTCIITKSKLMSKIN